MAGKRVVWGSAIVLSLLTHAGAAAMLTLSPSGADEAQIAGGVVAEIAMLGNGAFEAIESGEPEALEPTDTITPETIEPVPQPVAEIEPQEMLPEQAMPVDAVATPEADEIIPEMSEAIEIQGAAVEIATIPVPDVRPEITDQPPEVLKPLQEEAREPVETPKKKVEKKRKPKAGERGNSAQAAKKGQVDGSDKVKTASLGGQKKGNASTAGNAAVSNYPGKVRNKINRAKRRVAGASSGVVTVRFAVSASGQASGIRVAASSGQPELDQAAVDAVRRAAPFPAIPAEAGRSSWLFNVPIAFKR